MEQPQHQEQSEPEGEEEYGLHRCSLHPDVETRLACSRCGTYICPRCMIQTPVGARCGECAMVRKLPTFDVKPAYYFRAAVAGGVVAVVAGIVWALIRLYIPIIGPILSWPLAIGVGYLVGEAISLAANRKRGGGLPVIAGVGMVIAIAASGFWPPLSVHFIFWLLIVGGAFYTAISRVR